MKRTELCIKKFNSEGSNISQNHILIPFDTSETADSVFADPFCKTRDDTSTMFESDLYKSVNLDDFDHPSRSKSND